MVYAFLGVFAFIIVGSIIAAAIIIRRRKPSQTIVTLNLSPETPIAFTTKYGGLSSFKDTAYGVPTYTSNVSMNYSSVPDNQNYSSAATEKYEIEFSELKFGPEIGNGAFGTVCKGTWRESAVAIKILKAVNESALVEFRKEFMVMKSMKTHNNVVNLLGITSDKVCIVTEFLENGSLETYLYSDAKNRFSALSSNNN